MLTFKREMDPHSLTLERDGKRIGFLHWHPNSCPGGRIKLFAGPSAANELSIDEAEQVTRRYHEERLAAARFRDQQAARALTCDTCERHPETMRLAGGTVLRHGDHCQRETRAGCRVSRCPGTLLQTEAARA